MRFRAESYMPGADDDAEGAYPDALRTLSPRATGSGEWAFAFTCASIDMRSGGADDPYPARPGKLTGDADEFLLKLDQVIATKGAMPLRPITEVTPGELQ